MPPSNVSRDEPDVDPRQRAFSDHREHLWGLCYRITGDAAESEDLVQETFCRFVERPPADTSRPLRPWLATVATRLAIDALRRRKRRAYPGSWLPSPLLTDGPTQGSSPEESSPDDEVEHRYDLAESLTMAFLVALEALAPRQRAALVLRDVLGYSGTEVAEQLGTTPENVRVMLHRSRRALQPYAQDRCRPSAELAERARQACATMVGALMQRDLDKLQACLHEDAIFVSDSGGRFKSSTKVVRGQDRVARLLLGLGKHNEASSIREVFVNGVPGLCFEVATTDPRIAPVVLLQADTDDHGRLTVIRLLLNPDKLPDHPAVAGGR